LTSTTAPKKAGQPLLCRGLVGRERERQREKTGEREREGGGGVERRRWPTGHGEEERMAAPRAHAPGAVSIDAFFLSASDPRESFTGPAHHSYLEFYLRSTSSFGNSSA